MANCNSTASSVRTLTELVVLLKPQEIMDLAEKVYVAIETLTTGISGDFFSSDVTTGGFFMKSGRLKAKGVFFRSIHTPYISCPGWCRCHRSKKWEQN
jgi:hypothetical protein